MEKVRFSGSKPRLQFRFVNEKYLLALVERVSFCVCSVKKNLLWYGANLRVSQTMLNLNQNLFLIVSYCFCLFGEFAKALILSSSFA